MIQANELRIGNWICSENTLWGQTTVMAWEVRREDLEYIDLNPENYEPIPLTEEWLLKFGFEKVMVSEKFTTFKITKSGEKVSIYKRGFIVFRRGSRTLEYVHQLQNLYFALTGQELELKEKSV